MRKIAANIAHLPITTDALWKVPGQGEGEFVVKYFLHVETNFPHDSNDSHRIPFYSNITIREIETFSHSSAEPIRYIYCIITLENSLKSRSMEIFWNLTEQTVERHIPLEFVSTNRYTVYQHAFEEKANPSRG